jgi:hypothetical protein
LTRKVKPLDTVLPGAGGESSETRSSKTKKQKPIAAAEPAVAKSNKPAA